MTAKDDELLSDEELDTLNDDELVRLIMERVPRKDEAWARETLYILRGGPEDGLIV